MAAKKAVARKARWRKVIGLSVSPAVLFLATSPPTGTLQHYSPPPTFADHLLCADTSTFVAAMLQMRDRALEGKETQNDRSMVDGCLSECSSNRSVETLKT